MPRPAINPAPAPAINPAPAPAINPAPAPLTPLTPATLSSASAYPIGGIGAGTFCLEGTGAISHLSIRHHPDFFNEPPFFAALVIKRDQGAAQGRPGTGRPRPHFNQKIEWTGLNAADPVAASQHSYSGTYSAEAIDLLKKEGPKYQYGKGCLSDGVLGDWMARVCGLGEPLDAAKVKSHLQSVYTYNLKKDHSDYSNPQRPGYALGEALTGVRYDAVTQTLYVASKVGDFTSFLSTDGGFGNVSYQNGKAQLKVVYGTINVQHVVIGR